MTDHEWSPIDDDRWTAILADHTDDHATTNGTRNPEDSWQPINLNTLPDTPPVQPDLAPAGIVYPGKRHAFSGPPESAKTLAAYAIGLEIVRKGHPIILIDFEMGAYDTRTRLHELGATPQDLQFIHYLEPDQPATEPRIDHLITLQPALVIIDAAAGAYDLQGLDDNKRQDVEKWARLYTRRFFRHGIATLLIDHVVKNNETRGKYAIGSERKLGGIDVHLGYETITPISRGTTGHYKIVTHKDRGGYLQRGKLADLELVSDPETHRITWQFKPAEHAPDDEPFEPTHLMEKVSKYLEARAQEEEVTQRELEREITGKAGYVRAAVAALVRRGHVHEAPGPRNSKLLKSAVPYRENDPGNDCVPLRPDRVPDAVTPLRPTPSPPYGGRDAVDGPQTRSKPATASPADPSLDDIPF